MRGTGGKMEGDLRREEQQKEDKRDVEKQGGMKGERDENKNMRVSGFR